MALDESGIRGYGDQAISYDRGAGRSPGSGSGGGGADPAGKTPQQRAAIDAAIERSGGINTPGSIAGPARDRTYYDQMRARQQALIDRLHGISTGQIKSPAQELFEQQLGQAQNQNVGTSASLRDVGPGGQRQIAAQNAGVIQGQGIEQGNILKLQQQQQAEMALAQLYEQQRQGDMAFAAGESDQKLGDRQLNDSYANAQLMRLYGTNVANTARATSRAGSDLGEANAAAANSMRLVNDAAGLAAGGFGYLEKAGGGRTRSYSGPSLSDMNKPSYGWGGSGS